MSWSGLLARVGAVLMGCATIGCAEALDVGARYTELCAGCHTSRFSFSDDASRAATDAELMRIVRDGLPRRGMPSFEAGLSEAELAAVVRLLREHDARRPVSVGMSIEAEALNRERSGGYAIGTSPDGLTSV